MRWRQIWTAAAVAGLTAATTFGCADDGSGTDSRADAAPVVVATTSILGDVVQSTLGDSVEVEVIIPSGTDPHAFEPSARDIAGLRDATLIVSNGLGLEVGLADALNEASADGVPVLEVAPSMDPLPLAAGVHAHESDEDEHDDEHGGEGDAALDPHVWFDPARMASALPAIADAYLAADPGADAGAVRAASDAYADELLDVDGEVETILAAVPESNRYLVTNHDTFGYLADRYGFEVVGVVIPGGDTLAESSAAALESLIDEIDSHGVRAIFTDNTVSGDVSRVLADETETDVEVVALFTDSLGESGGPADSYVALLRTDANRIAAALG